MEPKKFELGIVENVNEENDENDGDDQDDKNPPIMTREELDKTPERLQSYTNETYSNIMVSSSNLHMNNS